MKKITSILIIPLIIGLLFLIDLNKPAPAPSQNSQPLTSTTTAIDPGQPKESAPTVFEKKLVNTAWIQLDEQGNETDEEYDFRDTKDNDPTHTYYDFNEYLHQRPGESGYWKIKGNTLTIVGSPSDIPPYDYIIIEITSDTLILSDEGTNITFVRIK